MEINKLNILEMKKIVSKEATLYIDKNLIYKIFNSGIDIGSRIKVIDIFLNHYITGSPEIYDFICDNSQIVGYTMKYYPKAIPFSQNMRFEYIRKKCLELIELYIDMKKTYNLCYFDFHSGNIYINNSSILLFDVDSCALGKEVNENISDKLLCDYVLSMIYKVMFFDYELYYTPSESQIIRSNLYKDINEKSIEKISNLELFTREVTKRDIKKVLKRIPYNIKSD